MKIAHNGLTLETVALGSLEVNTTFVISDQKNAIVFDPADDFGQLQSLITQLGITPILQIYTHAHFDHIGAAKEIKNCYQTPIALSPEDIPLYRQLREQTARFGMPIREPADVDFPLTETTSLTIQDPKLQQFLSDLKIIATPGHTRGGTCFYSEWFERPILIAGDTLFYQSIGRTDLPGGSYKDLVSSIKNKLLCLPESTLVITGHGPGTTIGNEARLNPYLSDNY